jgi:hypothetical protein
MIYDPGTVNQTIGNQIVVRPGGELINVMDLIYNFKDAQNVRGANVAILRSADKGATWSGPILIDKLQSVGVTIPGTGEPVRTGDIIPEIAVDPANGNLFVVWQDARFSGGAYDEVALSMSKDGGATWSRAIRVNVPNGNAAFTPSVRVNSAGTVGVTYYRFTGNAGLTGYFLATCSSGKDCTKSANWDESVITDTPFDMANAPVARGYFVGDYAGLAVGGRDFLAFFSQPHGSDKSSVFFHRAKR